MTEMSASMQYEDHVENKTKGLRGEEMILNET